MSDDELLDLAPILGLHGLSPAELDSVRRRRALADAQTRLEFDDLVRHTREAMATVSTTTVTEPPATLRVRLLEAIGTDSADDSPAVDTEPAPPEPIPLVPRQDRSRRNPRRLAYAVAAAAVAIAVGGLGWAIGSGLSTQQAPTEPATAQQVFTAGDVRSASGAVAGGQATLTYSDTADAGVLVMNDVPPPQPGSVYQMWLLGPNGATSAGTMTDKDVAPSTTAVIPHLGDATALAFTVEPPGGSASPGAIVAELPLR
ncbi:anti-sigma factor [Gordonia desulfuricans]|uniref:Regulator of SigK n=1 Tax=Gordonia desulfuricans TaxID=89051 RepID=A0A7K3LNI9_9ACTN|nr:anti-sigma factor [Gordonia desulfuricans]NDK89763.1 anti-sigma factor [Gordonia desulfuricans]